ncbi:MAG: anti-sigma factor domain-containing protein [Candidatus Binataceae bacterium]
MTHDELKELLPLKALDRLEIDEERALAAHLASGCAECEQELASFRETLGALALASADEGAAGDRIWQLLEQRLAPDRIVSDARAGSRARDVAPRRPARMRLFSGLATAAAAVLAIALGFTVLSLERGLEAARATTSYEVAALRERIDDLQHGLEQASMQISNLKSQLSLTSTLTLAAFSPDTHVVRLAGQSVAPKANATLALSLSNRTAFMQIAGLPPAPADKVYEVWWIGRHAGPIRAGLFNAPAEGTAKVDLTLPPEGEEILASAITLEPAGGRDTPTMPLYLKGDVPH